MSTSINQIKFCIAFNFYKFQKYLLLNFSTNLKTKKFVTNYPKLYVLSVIMIIQCKSCQKSFVVPDNAITSSGRLVQCSSCGNKWTQYPVLQKEKVVNITQTTVKKSEIKKKRVKKQKKKN